ncbi:MULTISPECIES: LysR substrate-binding domain-containing protein [unclassified Streptomyces]|uniref:LysR substrate-binding domain-containing protein n=1 Tax=unclassified Streptomyces TaxID=2593676 RepID=UPI002DD8E8E5|nr:LysR substrate-binding domain-containing protein [Streptomyces sp. NBC_01766]WSC20369.1 LysR substrate-binding domain-containing protein [Streptomyces sp. NBC_01766]WSV54403.1 LysR substrate-binding domain-containing protein [Streptomyces sp. NBC_01014]
MSASTAKASRQAPATAPIVPTGRTAQVTPGRLAEEDMVDMPPGSGIRRHNDAAFTAAAVTRTVAFEADTMALLEQLVARDLGIGLVPAATAATMPGVSAVATTGVPPRTVRAVWTASGASPAARAFLQLLRERTPKAPAEDGLGAQRSSS